MRVVVTKSLEGTKTEFIEMIAKRMAVHADIAAGKGKKRPQKEREASEQVAAALEEVINDLEAWTELPEPPEPVVEENGAADTLRILDGAPTRG